ncbi:MAG TPA: hypothetical protein VIM58_05705, partial [Candidatus Methylacidiphilales bacterium]
PSQAASPAASSAAAPSATAPAPAPAASSSGSGGTSSSSSSSSGASAASSEAASAAANSAAANEATYTNSYGDTVSMSGVVLVAARGDGHKGETDPDIEQKHAEAAANSPTAAPQPGAVPAAPSSSLSSQSDSDLAGEQRLLKKTYSQS